MFPPSLSYWIKRSAFRITLPALLLVVSNQYVLAQPTAGSGWYNPSITEVPQGLAIGGAKGPTSTVSEPATVHLAPQKLAQQNMQLLSSFNVHPEIAAVAEALGKDPLTIFNWVRNKIDYVHYRGAKKGALMTLIERSGNDADQSLLLRELLRAAGYSPDLVKGSVAVPYEDPSGFDLRHWLGLPQAAFSNNHVEFFLISRGTLVSKLVKYTDAFKIERVWVSVNVGGLDYYLDPSAKIYQQVSGIDIAAASGYQQTTALSQLGGNVDDNGTSINTVNETALGNFLRDRTASLLQTLAQPGNAFRTPLEVTGGWRLQEQDADFLWQAFPLPYYIFETDVWSDVPADHTATLSLRLGNSLTPGQETINISKPLPEMAGRRLTLEFAKSGSDTKAQIWLDDELWAEEANFVAGLTTNLEIKIDHPANGTDLDQTFTQTYKRTVTANGMPNGTAIYALSYGFDISQESLRRRERKLEDYKAVGKADTSREVLGEVLNVIGQQWYLQTELVGRTLANMAGCAHQNHHRIGRIAQEESIYIDVMGQFTGTLSRTANIEETQNVFATETFYWSAMEHGVLSQLQDISAASTVSLLSKANTLTASNKIFVVRTVVEYDAIAGQLTNYNATQKGDIRAKALAGSTVVLHQNGKLKINPTDAWQGAGYAAVSPIEAAMIIFENKINGGYAGYNIQANISTPQYNYYAGTDYITPQSTTYRASSFEPVDLATGLYYTTPNQDLTVGSTLSLSRSYEGGRRTQDIAGIGYGWTHSGHLRLSERTSVEHGLGLRSAPDMAALLVSAVAALDLYRSRAADNNFQKKWVGTVFASNWAVNLLKKNSVSVQLPEKNMEFTRQLDGSYTSPPGMPVALVKNATPNTYTITPRHGATTTFEAVPNSAGNYRIKQTVDLWNRTQSYAYDGTSGKLTSITDPFSRSLTFAYAGDRLTSVSDSTGRGVSYSYDTNGNLTTFTDPEGKSDRFTYDDKHRIVEIKDHTNRSLIKNFYDDQHRVIEQHNQSLPDRDWTYAYAPGVTREKDPADAYTVHLFDDRSRSTGKIDALGHRHRIGYDGRDHQTTNISPLGRTSVVEYDANDNLVKSTDPTGAVSTTDYDAQHRPTLVTDPLNRTSSATYNAKHQIVTSTNALNETTTNNYDPVTGYLSSSINHVNHTTSYEYDTYGQLTKTILPGNIVLQQQVSARGDVEWAKDARSVQTTYSYNRRRELIATTTGGRTTTVAYDDNRKAAAVTNARGFTTQTTYTSTGKPVTTTAPDGSSATNHYDRRELVVSAIGPIGEVTQTDFDLLNRPQTVTDPLNRSITTVYDEDGMTDQIQAPLGRNTHTNYQVAPNQPRLLTIINPLNHNTVSQYDAAGQHRYLTNHNGQIFEMNYDALGRPTTTIQPGGRTHTIDYSWNATGLLQTLYEPSDDRVYIQHDALGRVVTRSYYDNTTIDFTGSSHTYDPKGNLLATTGDGQTITRTYEPDRDLVSTYTNGEGQTIAYTYDKSGNLSTLTYPGGKVVTYAYDSNDRLLRVTDWAGRATLFEYDASSRMTAIKRPNGTIRRMVYDPAGQMSSFTEVAPNGSTIARQGWQYDAGGRPTQRLRVPGATAFTSPTSTATYHSDNRLATISPQGSGTFHTNLDPDGNLLEARIWESTRSWQQANFFWDSRNRLQTFSNFQSQITVNYTYDAEGHLIKRSPLGAEAHPVYTVNPHAGLSQVLITHNDKYSGWNTYHVYGGGGLLYEERYDDVGQSQGTRTYHYDQVGSTIALTNDAGGVTGRLEYSAYGLTSHTSGNVDTAFRYNGRFGIMTDPDTGLLHMRARWYSPSLGRFLNEDPIRFEGGPNWYAYAGGDPYQKIDPNGEAWFVIGALIGGGLDYAAQVASNYASGKSGSDAWTDVSVKSIAISAAAGAITGGIGGAISKQAATSTGSALTRTIVGRAALNGAANGSVSGAAQITKNYSGVNGDAGRANIWGGVEGAVAFGAVTGALASAGSDTILRSTQNWAQGIWNRASPLAQTLHINNAVTGTGVGIIPRLDAFLGNSLGVAGNFVSNSPWNPIASWSPMGLNTPPTNSNRCR